jgi:hypothetical protein
METKGRGSTRLAPLTIVILTVGLLYILPSKALLIVLLWSLLSVPIGILIGHCVLRDE